MQFAQLISSYRDYKSSWLKESLPFSQLVSVRAQKQGQGFYSGVRDGQVNCYLKSPQVHNICKALHGVEGAVGMPAPSFCWWTGRPGWQRVVSAGGRSAGGPAGIC